MMGKFAAVIGPTLMGWVALLTGSSRLAILSIALLFALGAILLAFVRPDSAASSPGPAGSSS
jgi:UMF1 family MFS transporter